MYCVGLIAIVVVEANASISVRYIIYNKNNKYYLSQVKRIPKSTLSTFALNFANLKTQRLYV